MQRQRVSRLFGLVVRLVAVGSAVACVQLVSVPAASADPAPDAWQRLRTCESGDNYTIVSSNGRYYGAYQFDLATWRSVGGTGAPNQASPAEQDYRALYLYRMRGWQPWTCARILRLATDADAATGVVPPAPAGL
jgi:hypothetical protein